MLRIDTNSFFTASLAGMRDNQSAMARLNEQIATGKALLAPKDDPLATEKILQLSNRVAVRTQFQSNQDRASLALKYESTVLAEMRKALEDAQDLIAGVSPAHDASLRNTVAQQLAGVSRHILSLANIRDPNGNYIFGGQATTAAPYANPLDGTATATTYSGTPLLPTATAPDGQTGPGGSRWLEVDTGRYVRVNDNLDAVLQSGTANDLLQELDDAAATIPGGTLTQTAIDGWTALLTTAITRLDAISHRVAAAYGEVEDVRETTGALLLQEKNALSDIQQVDQAAAIMELQLRQTALQAAGSAFARTAGLSLFNYLG
jgi:flagellar hook-associated protein 3 FlgL